MGRVIVIQFASLDGVVQDPDGSEGFEHGGWPFGIKEATTRPKRMASAARSMRPE